ncbi:MAG: SEL1-like repeat protein [Lachnospiraceae bacterium]|nr:SEL1-like repeat protein [Lachnospiraceae bacterium]
MRQKIARILSIILFVTVCTCPLAVSAEDYSEMSNRDLKVLSYDGDANAAYELALRLDYGYEGTPRDFEEAMKQYEVSASHGKKEAYTALGYMYLNGIGTEKDPEKAREYFETALSKGDWEANVGMGRYYLSLWEESDHKETLRDALPAENEDTEEEDYEKLAFDYIVKAADMHLLDGIYYKGYCYEKGICVPENKRTAASIYETVFMTDPDDENEDEDETAEKTEIENGYIYDASHVRLGIIFMDEKSGVYDEEKAIDHFKTAADNEYAEGQYYLGLMNLYGYGTNEDEDKALELITMAADQDFPPALNQLGVFYFNGTIVDVDLTKAAYYQKLACSYGYTPAQINMGYMYENGYGVEQDLYTALSYYKMASEKGYKGAEEAVKRVENLIHDTED